MKRLIIVLCLLLTPFVFGSKRNSRFVHTFIQKDASSETRILYDKQTGVSYLVYLDLYKGGVGITELKKGR